MPNCADCGLGDFIGPIACQMCEEKNVEQETYSAAEIKAAGDLQNWLASMANTRPTGKGPRMPQDASKAKSLPDVQANPQSPNRRPSTALKRPCPQSRGRLPTDRLLGYEAERMKNDMERRYAEKLETMKRNGELALWLYEPIHLRLASNTFYIPDFLLLFPDGHMEFHETKGFWRDDARVKTKCAAEMFPMFLFVGVQWDRKRKDWKYENFGG